LLQPPAQIVRKSMQTHQANRLSLGPDRRAISGGGTALTSAQAVSLSGMRCAQASA
jgi:hypothetical protein